MQRGAARCFVGQTDGMWRSFDVGDVVESLPDEARVVAGAGGMTRSVGGAKLVSTPDRLHRARANDLVVAAADTVVDNGRGWEYLVGRLEAAHVAAVAVRLNESEPLPSGLIAAANRHAVPFITFPATTELADVTSAILDALLEAQGRRLERVLDIHRRFTPIVLGGGGPAEIAAALHSLLGCPVAVVDAEGRPMAVVPSDVADNVVVPSGPAVRQAIVAGEDVYGEVLAFAVDGELDEDGHLALQRASLAIAVAIRQAHATAASADRERFAAASLEELIAGNAGDIADVVERAASFGWDLARPRAVLLVSVDPWTDREHLSTAIGMISFAARATLGEDAIVWARSTSVAALVAPQSPDPAERRRIAEMLRQELDERVTSVTVSIGVGRCVDDPLQLPRSYVEASRAVDVGRWAKGRHVTEVFDELGLERLLASTPTDDLADFVEQAIGTLVAYDRSHNTDLVVTLGMWLESHNMAEAARRLHVHYNTLKNRLARIEAIAGPLLGDSARSLECSIAIYVFRHYDGPWKATTST